MVLESEEGWGGTHSRREPRGVGCCTGSPRADLAPLQGKGLQHAWLRVHKGQPLCSRLTYSQRNRSTGTAAHAKECSRCCSNHGGFSSARAACWCSCAADTTAQGGQVYRRCMLCQMLQLPKHQSTARASSPLASTTGGGGGGSGGGELWQAWRHGACHWRRVVYRLCDHTNTERCSKRAEARCSSQRACCAEVSQHGGCACAGGRPSPPLHHQGRGSTAGSGLEGGAASGSHTPALQHMGDWPLGAAPL